MLSRSRLRRRDRGLSLVLMSLLLVTMLGIAALVVDLGSWQVEASSMQQAADAASLAGVVRLVDGEDKAIARALQVAADNGYDNKTDLDVTVTAEALGDETLEVTITKTNVRQYFSQVVRDDPTTITRRSTSQYVQPVPLGSPRNYLGTNALPIGVTGNGVENFYLAVSGKCMRREYGDRVGGISARNPREDISHSCEPNAGGVIGNPEFDDEAYLFGIRVPEGAGATAVQMFDAPVCTDRSGTDVIFGEQSAPFDVQVTVRRFDTIDPIDGTQLSQQTYQGEPNTTSGLCQAGSTTNGECSAADRLRNCWHTLIDLPGAGEYTVQIQSVQSTSNPYGHNERHDVFSLRAKSGSAFTPCTSDTAVRDGLPGNPPTPPYDANCPQVFGLEHLPIYARGSNDALFFLASIDKRHNSKTLLVTFYDTAEGATGLQLVNPAGVAVPFTWEILCANGASAAGGTCPGENQPIGGRSGSSTPLPGDGTPHLDLPDDFAPNDFTYRTYGNRNVQVGGYSDRLIRLTVQMPGDIDTAYGGATWWKVRYLGNFTGDRTTWTVQLLGDPVRLVPNTTTTTSAP